MAHPIDDVPGAPYAPDLPSAEEPRSDRTRLVGQEGGEGLPRIYVAREALEFVQRCARAALSAEATGGWLMGQAFRSPGGRRFIVVDGVVEAPEVEAVGRSVKFTPRAWKGLRAAAASRFAGRSPVGWFHARPGESPELSSYETFVHQTHFGAPWQVAMVVDSATGTATFWGWNGEVLERVPGFRVHEGPVAALITAAELRREGWLPAADEAAAAASTPPDGWRRGTWPVTPVQERVRARRSGRPSAWHQAARVVQGVTLLVLVFVAAMSARWLLDRLWPRAADGGITTRGPAAPAAMPVRELGGGPGEVARPGGETEVMGGGPGVPARPDTSAPSPGPPLPLAAAGSGPGELAGPGAAPPVAATPAGGSGAGSGSPPGEAVMQPSQAGGGSASLASTPEMGSTYVVRQGDTLWAISQRFYGDPLRHEWLARVNGLPDPGRIFEGQRLVLPPAGELPPARK